MCSSYHNNIIIMMFHELQCDSYCGMTNQMFSIELQVLCVCVCVILLPNYQTCKARKHPLVSGVDSYSKKMS